jgi:hypothetical protein
VVAGGQGAGHHRAVAKTLPPARRRPRCRTPARLCGVHGHSHDVARKSSPVSNFAGFWGALGCSCFAF